MNTLKNKINAEAGRVWSHVHEALNFNHHKHGTKLFKLNLEEERDYRKTYTPEERQWGITMAQTARLLSLQWLIKYHRDLKPIIEGESYPLPTIGEILYCKPSCMYAGALVAEYPDKIRNAFLECGADTELLLSPAAKYTQMSKTEQEETAP